MKILFSNFLKASTVLVFLVALIIGFVSTYSPELFFRIPEVGFVLWAVTGHPVPPYFDQAAFEKPSFEQWARDGDCIVGSLAKSGTVWMHTIIHLLKSGGRDDFDSLFEDHVGMPDFLLYPQHTLELRTKQTNQKRDRNPYPLMTHFTHLSPGSGVDGLDVRKHPKIKYVVTMRNPREIVRSFYTFLNNHTPEFRALWGGFPPPLKSSEAALDFALQNSNLLFEPAKAWWEVRNEPNVLLVHFSDLKRDTEKEVKRLASFLGISLDDGKYKVKETDTSVTADKNKQTLLQTILHKSSFDYMKERQKRVPTAYVARFGPPDSNEIVNTDHINVGKSDGAKDFFTDEMDRKLEGGMQNFLGDTPELMLWLKEGGVYQ